MQTTIHVDTAPVAVLKGSKAEGQLLFINTSTVGPLLDMEAWRVRLTVSGEVGMISTKFAQIPVSMEILNDATNHPDQPFFVLSERSR